MGFFFTLHVWRIMALILFCTGMIGTASAVVITESPSHVMRGEPITIDIEGLSNSAEFSLLIEATLGVTPGQEFLFETTNFAMPLALDNGQISAKTTGAQQATFSAKKGGTTVSVTRAADPGGVFSFSQAQSIPAGTFDYIRLQGTPLPTTNTIVSTIRLNGKKTGPDNSHISFTVNGIDNGKVQLTVNVDGSQALYQTVTIGEGITSGQTTIVPSSNSGGSPVPGTTTTLAPAPVNTSSVKTFFSADHHASLTVQKGERAGLVAVTPTGVPSAWTAVGDAYTVNPKSVIFSPAATISLSIPEHAAYDAASVYFIGGLKNNEWVRLPSTVQNTTVTADIDGAGTYAIMVYKPESTPVPTTVPSAGTITTGDTPQDGAVGQETSATPASPLLTMSILPVFGALAIGIGIALVNKK
jgi:hypothetical protein